MKNKIAVKEPKIFNNLINKNDFLRLKKFLLNIPKERMIFDRRHGRYKLSEDDLCIFSQYAKLLTPAARKFFNSKTLIPSYVLFAHYEGELACLPKHKDRNACTYTLDLCVYQKYPWDIWVENKPYTLKENQALGFYGNDQEHWREAFPNPKTNYVGMLFFHFVEPEHWFYTKGPTYFEKICEEKMK